MWPFRRGRGSARDVPWIPPEHGDPRGLVGVGGDLSPATLVRAYSEGVFPWYNEGDPILWWSPDPRAIIPLDALHVPKRLARTIRSGKFRVTINQCFREVMWACGEERPEGTWVTRDMLDGYTEAHKAGVTHSLEVWVAPGSAGVSPAPTNPAGGTPALPGPEPGWQLAGGIYGVAVGGLFAGESMFHRVTDASKVALVALVERLRERGYVLFDVQMKTNVSGQLGAVEIPRAEYLRRLREAVKLTNVTFV
ncbi:MAG TPA: leucyl/phenylalanyl-tRNA--protein transferase [Gemmataceae bacterium]|nr:leucyl/phenylalanyl-tRNA--protein transferase [Gemmataceae bacterium]